jgi:hypothetical protein
VPKEFEPHGLELEELDLKPVEKPVEDDDETKKLKLAQAKSAVDVANTVI